MISFMLSGKLAYAPKSGTKQNGDPYTHLLVNDSHTYVAADGTQKVYNNYVSVWCSKFTRTNLQPNEALAEGSYVVVRGEVKATVRQKQDGTYMGQLEVDAAEVEVVR